MWEKIKNIFRIKRGMWAWTSRAEKEQLINDMVSKIDELEQDIRLLIQQVGEIAAYCDKCDGNKIGFCMKCSNSGIVKKNRLREWPW